MSKEVIIVHDELDTITIVQYLCEQAGLLVLGGATTFNEAVALIQNANNLAALLTDGNITHGELYGREGGQLAELARSLHPGVIIASISGENQRWSDYPYTNSLKPGLKAIVNMVQNDLED